jgi:hypothetical protein
VLRRKEKAGRKKKYERKKKFNEIGERDRRTV